MSGGSRKQPYRGCRGGVPPPPPESEPISVILSPLHVTSSTAAASGFESDKSTPAAAGDAGHVNVNATQQAPGQVLKLWKDYAVTGKLDNFPPLVIHIKDYGQLTFPIHLDKIVEDLRPFMDKSDYSMDNGERRIYDASIRQSSEIPSVRLQFNDTNWAQYVKDTILPKAGEGLGFDHLATKAELNKLLIYEKGSFFAAHSDVMKVPGHFGTLIVQLPSRYSGGQLKCSYGQLEKKVFDQSSCREINVEVQNKNFNCTIAVNPSDPIDVLKSKIVNEMGEMYQKYYHRFYVSSAPGKTSKFLNEYNYKSVEDLGLELPSRGNEFCGFYTAFYLDVEHEVEKVTSGIRACLVYNLIDTTITTSTIMSPKNLLINDNGRPTLTLELRKVILGD